MKISEFDIENWQLEVETTPEWLNPGVEELFFSQFNKLVEEVKSFVSNCPTPSLLSISSYQVSNSDVTTALGKSRSALRRERYPKLFVYFEETNEFLCAYWHHHCAKKARPAKPLKNSVPLEENKSLKREIQKIKHLMHRRFLEQLISNTDNMELVDKVGKIEDLELRNAELERQVARLTYQLRNTLKRI
ncbi:hypothetical protein GTH32_16600 [Alteromonas sp. 345S023]|uniref:Uncharacterized protein n=1 Tax=Alteromonas profundi TaxID=2696062 RepID=A0A7X5RMB2_9ALTE|nr:hypothetical protein [Alteromonas profundi]NDV92792.1 hypothetical protein [Alteromonas profundi]